MVEHEYPNENGEKLNETHLKFQKLPTKHKLRYGAQIRVIRGTECSNLSMSIYNMSNILSILKLEYLSRTVCNIILFLADRKDAVVSYYYVFIYIVEERDFLTWEQTRIKEEHTKFFSRSDKILTIADTLSPFLTIGLKETILPN